jgi:hypothetical protein
VLAVVYIYGLMAREGKVAWKEAQRADVQREMHFAPNRGPSLLEAGLSLTSLALINTIYYYELVLMPLNKRNY